MVRIKMRGLGASANRSLVGMFFEAARICGRSIPSGRDLPLWALSNMAFMNRSGRNGRRRYGPQRRGFQNMAGSAGNPLFRERRKYIRMRIGCGNSNGWKKNLPGALRRVFPVRRKKMENPSFPGYDQGEENRIIPPPIPPPGRQEIHPESGRAFA